MSTPIKYVTAFLLMLLFNTYPVFSQEMDLTMEKAIELARKQSFEAFRAKNAFLVKTLNFESYKKMLYPKLNASLTPGNYDRSISEFWDSEEGRYKPYEVQWLTSVGSLSLMQPVKLTGGRFYVSSSLRRSQTYYEGSDDELSFISNPFSIRYSQELYAVNEYKWKSKLEPLEFEEAKQQYMEDVESTTLKTIELYYNLLDADLNYTISRLNKNNADTLYLFCQRKLEIGAITRAEYLRLELNKVNAGIDLETQKRKRSEAMVSLNNFLELPRETELICQRSTAIPRISISVSQVILKAIENNPDMIALEQKLIESQRAIKSANSNRLSVSFNANLGLNQNKEAFSEAYRDLRDMQGVMFTVSMPIVDWGDNKRTIQQAKLNNRLVEENNRKQKDALEIEVLNMVEDFSIQQQQIKASALADSIAKVAYEAVQQQFLLGKVSITELNNSYTDLQNAQNKYIHSLRSFWLQLYALRKICLYDFEKNEDLSFDEASILIE